MFNKWYAKLFISLSLVVLLAACSSFMKEQPQADQPKKPLTAVEVLRKAEEAMKKGKGYSYTLTGSYEFKVNIPDSPISGIEMPIEMVAELDPKGETGHLKGNMSLFSVQIPMHMYLDKKAMYQEINGKWYKFTDPKQSNRTKNPMDDLDLYLMISKEAPQALKMKEEKDMYVIELDSKSFPENVKQKLLDEIQKKMDGPFPEDPKSATKLVQFSDKLLIDKKTFVMKSEIFFGKTEYIDQKRKDKVTMEMKLDAKLNKELDQSIIVPEDVKNNAIDFNELSDQEKEEVLNEMVRSGFFSGPEEDRL